METTRRRRPTCARCPSRPALDLLQPDDRDYVRLLATCPQCGRWYLRLENSGGSSVTTELPVPTLADLRIIPMPPPSQEECRAASLGLMVTA